MSVRAKFKLNSITSQMQYMSEPTGEKDAQGRSIDRGVHKEMRTLVFNPVYGNGDPEHENTRFWQASPQGELKLGVINQQAWEQFELGKEYYLDFIPAE
jgi:hypothetical protein